MVLLTVVYFVVMLTVVYGVADLMIACRSFGSVCGGGAEVLWRYLGGAVADLTIVLSLFSDLFVEVVQICFRGCCLRNHGF